MVADTWSQALASMALRMLNLGKNLLSSKVRYFAFKLRITLWSIGWVMEVAFFGRKTTVIAFRFSIYGCTRKLSMIITTFHPSRWNLFSNSYSRSSKSSPPIQLFACGCYRHGKCLIPEEYLGFLDMSIANIGNFSR